jgi:FkbM family methyltransferase
MADYEFMLEQTDRAFLSAGDVCVDVGAHAGRHTVPMAACCGPSGRILAFAPIPSMVKALREQISSNPELVTVRLEQCALSDVDGEAEFVLWLTQTKSRRARLG